MKIQRAKKCMQFWLDCLCATRSVIAGRIVATGRLFKNGGRLSFQLPIILLQICGAAGNAQSTLGIAVHGNQTVETFSFLRINTISDTHTIDTFTRVKETGDYRLQVRNVLIPGTGFVRQGNRSLREVFIAPGYPLQIIISNNPGIPTEKIEGAWGELDSVFQKATSRQPAAFNLGYTSLN